MTPSRRHFLHVLLGSAAWSGWAARGGRVRAAEPAGEKKPAKRKVILTVSGLIRKPGAGGKVEFDMAALERLKQHSFSTKTPWHETPRKFTGPRLRDLLEEVGAEGKMLRAIALNDYRVEIPVEDATKYDMIVARLMDDRPMPVRDKGPLFILYPFDARPELQSALYYSRAAWQLKAIEVY